MDTDRTRIVISLFERIRIRIRILRHGYSTDMQKCVLKISEKSDFEIRHCAMPC